MGYHKAGFDVIGVDHKPMPRYPFTFHLGDAMTWPLDGFDAIHASPPCQDHTLTPNPRIHGTAWMLPAIRERLEQSGIPWVIENVPGAPMRADYEICGCQVGLALRRRRIFETSWAGFDLAPPCFHEGPVVSVVGRGTPSWVRKQFGYNPTIHQYRAAMGIDWMNREELSQAIPPAYTQYIGGHLLDHLRP
jgi:DNA (cytosine-5)-methyltransferase 1